MAEAVSKQSQPGGSQIEPEASEHPAVLCAECQKLDLAALLRLPSWTLRHNIADLEESEWVKACLQNLPELVDVKHVRRTYAQCRLCNVIYSQIKGSLAENEDYLALYSTDDSAKLHDLLLYTEHGQSSVAQLALFAEEGDDVTE